MPYKKIDRLMRLPQVRVQRLTAPAANARVYSNLISRKEFIAAIISLKLIHGENPASGNLPTRMEVYGVEDPDDLAATRILVTAKDLTDVTDWSGTMQIEVDETHFAALFGSRPDESPRSLDYLQVAISGPENEEYDVVVQLCDPYTESKELLDEANV